MIEHDGMIVSDEVSDALFDAPKGVAFTADALGFLRDDDTIAPWLTRERHMAILRELWDAG